uniref:Uncharacterized protein n=1 Tax=Panagrolaimus sp. JU765 TaxID=591449 RepID=A0AC34Q6C6_9BILA
MKLVIFVFVCTFAVVVKTQCCPDGEEGFVEKTLEKRSIRNHSHAKNILDAVKEFTEGNLSFLTKKFSFLVAKTEDPELYEQINKGICCVRCCCNITGPHQACCCVVSKTGEAESEIGRTISVSEL